MMREGITVTVPITVGPDEDVITGDDVDVRSAAGTNNVVNVPMLVAVLNDHVVAPPGNVGADAAAKYAELVPPSESNVHEYISVRPAGSIGANAASAVSMIVAADDPLAVADPTMLAPPLVHVHVIAMMSVPKLTPIGWTMMLVSFVGTLALVA